jgi:hypothetical protein
VSRTPTPEVRALECNVPACYDWADPVMSGLCLRVESRPLLTNRKRIEFQPP